MFQFNLVCKISEGIKRPSVILIVKLSSVFKLACTKVQRTIIVTLMLVWALASYFNVLCLSFLCDGQGFVRQAILYVGRSRFSFFVCVLNWPYMADGRHWSKVLFCIIKLEVKVLD